MTDLKRFNLTSGAPERWATFALQARDETVHLAIRASAAGMLTPPMTTQATALEAARSLFAAPEPVLRSRAITLCVRFGLVSLCPLLEALRDDPATFWENQVEISVAKEARAALEHLRAGRPVFVDRHAAWSWPDNRLAVFSLSPEGIGVTKDHFPYPVFAIVMDTGRPEFTSMLVCLANGRTELYRSDGSWTLGGGDHESVQQAAEHLLAGAQHHYLAASPVTVVPETEAGTVAFYFLTAEGVRRYVAVEAELIQGEHAFSRLYAAGQGVLAALHKAEDAFVDTMTQQVEIPSHQLDWPDPEDELAFMEEMIGNLVNTIHKMSGNLGSSFDDALRLLGFRVALGRSRPEIVDALRTICELGVAVFQRGSVGPEVTVTLSICGTKIDIAGGGHGYTSAPRWASAVGAAMTLRDRAAIDSLCGFNARNFQGNYDRYHDLFAKALMSHHHAESDVQALLHAARVNAKKAKIFPNLGQEVGVPLVEVAQAVLAGDAGAFHDRLVEGLTRYRDLSAQPTFKHEADRMIPLRYLGLCALAHDRGLPCRVKSDYIPSWLIEGATES